VTEHPEKGRAELRDGQQRVIREYIRNQELEEKREEQLRIEGL